jgi:hypothetical protein
MTEHHRDLVAPASLSRGDLLYSPTRAYRLALRADGDLALEPIEEATLPVDVTHGSYGAAIWTAGTGASDIARCDLQFDGNLVLYDSLNRPRWHTNTAGTPGAFLRCQDDGNLVLYNAAGAAAWHTNTYAGSR